MGALEIAGIIGAVILYLLFRAFNGPKLSDGRGREPRDEEAADNTDTDNRGASKVQVSA